MLDHINWYLVELERKLRNKRTAQATADMLVEARAHLEEHASEMVAKGLDPVSAAKAAVADFGDPSSVLQAYSGVGGTSLRTYRVLTIAASLLLSSLVVTTYIWVFNPLMLETSAVWLTTIPWLTIPVVVWAGFRTRRWIALPVAGASLAFALVAGIWATAKSELMQLGGQTRMVYMPMVERQIDLRQAWLARANADFALLQGWRAKRNAPEGDVLLKKLAMQGNTFVAPFPFGYARWIVVVPSDYYQRTDRFIPYVDDYRPFGFGISQSPDFKYAREMWRANGDKYAEFLKRRLSDITKEVGVLGSIQPTPWSEKWGTIGFAPIPMVGTASLILLALNGVAIGASSVLASSRRQRWRRQLG